MRSAASSANHVSEIRAAKHVQTWAQTRQWRRALPAGTLSRWQKLQQPFSSRSSEEQTLRVEHLVSAAVQPAFELIPSEIGSGRPGIHSALRRGSKSGEAGPSNLAPSGQSDDVVTA